MINEMHDLKDVHKQWSKSIKKYKRELFELNDLYDLPDNVIQNVEQQRQREKNDFENYANPRQLAELRLGNFWNSVFLMNEKKKNKGKERTWFELKDVQELELSGNKFVGNNFKGEVNGI